MTDEIRQVAATRAFRKETACSRPKRCSPAPMRLLLLLCLAACAAANPPVVLEVYVEALCPDCLRFGLTQLEPALSHLEILNIVQLQLVPYGNTKVQLRLSSALACLTPLRSIRTVRTAVSTARTSACQTSTASVCSPLWAEGWTPSRAALPPGRRCHTSTAWTAGEGIQASQPIVSETRSHRAPRAGRRCWTARRMRRRARLCRLLVETPRRLSTPLCHGWS